MEDVPAGHADSSASTSSGVITSTQARPSASRARQSSSGSASTACSERSAAVAEPRRGAPSGSSTNSRAGRVQRRRGSGCAQPAARRSGPRIDRVGQGVAVDLAGSGSGIRPAPRPRTPACEPGVALGRCRVPAKAVAGSTPERSRGSRREHEVDLELAALGRRAAARRADRCRAAGAQPASTSGPRSELLPSASVTVAPPRGLRGRPDDPGPVRSSAPASVGDPDQLGGHRAHPADGHPPLPGAVADDVVEEAAVLPQARVVRADAKVPIRASVSTTPRTASSAKARLDQLAERSLDQRPPQVRLELRPASSAAPGERLGQGRGDDGRERSASSLQPLPGRVLVVAAGERGEGGSRSPALGPLDQQAAVADRGVGRDRRERSSRSRPRSSTIAGAAARPGRRSGTAGRRRRGTAGRRPPRPPSRVGAPRARPRDRPARAR